MPDQRDALRNIRTFPQLIKFLRDEMDWPIGSEDFEELTFDYTAEELGIDTASAAKIQEIKRLRPLAAGQPWGIFFVKFEPKRLPVVALRRILSRVVLKKRASANSADRAAWRADDLLFVSNYGEGDQRQISFAHFSQDGEKADLPTLKVLGWDDRDTALRLDDVAVELTSNLSWPEDEEDTEDWRRKWRSAFTLRHREVITTSKALAVRLADLAQGIRKRVNAVLKIESDKGPLRRLHSAFREALIHDLSEDDFADMYAQTIAYGLLTARVSRPSGLVAENLSDMVPITNPFLKDLLDSFLAAGGRKGKVDFDELGVSEVVQLLREAHMEAVLRDFGDRNPEEDPAIHFYELFLKEYDPRKRLRRGVFYTPRPVVSYIVRSVHELLQTEFGLEDGLASTVTWGEMAKRHKDLKIPAGVAADSAFVQILDPATGTATFLVEVIEVIHRTLTDKWKQQRLTDPQQRAAWNDYVPRRLLPRLHGYELMMAPYAIAHMKLPLKLKETGFTAWDKLGANDRARVYLTNALEPASDDSKQMTFAEWAPALAHEAQAVNAIKRHQRFTVVIGNPPYDYESQNNSDYIRNLVGKYYEVDRIPLGERNPKGLQDDYVKFVRFAEHSLLEAGVGVFGFITNNSFMDNPTYRGMRFSLLSTYQKLWCFNLHGNSNIRALGLTLERDENVFAIRQGVSISLFVRSGHSGRTGQCRYFSKYGTRQEKTNFLNGLPTLSTEGYDFFPSADQWLLIPLRADEKAEYETFLKIISVMPLNSVGLYTARDEFVIGDDPGGLLKRMKRFIELSPTATREEFKLSEDSADWKIERAQKDVRDSGCNGNCILPISYRPFEQRFTYYTGKSSGIICRPRREVMNHLLSGPNVALCFLRRSREKICSGFFVARGLIDKTILSSADNANVAPLFLYSSMDGLCLSQTKSVNYSPQSLRSIADVLCIVGDSSDGLPQGLTPEDIFHYAYAVFHSPGYRNRYAEFLKIDFPRLPLTGNLELFRSLARLGGELVSLHLLESPKLDQPLTTYTGPATPGVEKVSYARDTVWLDKAQTRGFCGVPEAVWNFHIGGYQVCQKWLKDRRGRVLSDDDIAHYHKIVVALNETIRLMQEIDEVIATHGGWPAAFHTKLHS